MTDSICFAKSTPLSVFSGPFQYYIYVAYILKMCIKKFESEKVF